MAEVLDYSERLECVTCGHEWERAPEPEAPAGPRVVKDAHGNVLADGDCVSWIKELPLKGSSQVLKGGTKSKPIRLVDDDHEFSCEMDGMAIGLNACFVKKASGARYHHADGDKVSAVFWRWAILRRDCFCRLGQSDAQWRPWGDTSACW